jgi:hypothetical protein
MAKILTLKATSDIVAYYEDDQELGLMERAQIANGLFDLTTVEGTREEVQAQANALQPKIVQCWEDPTTGEIKKLDKRPKYSMKLTDGSFQATLPLEATNHVLANQEIKTELDSIKTELSAKDIVLDAVKIVETVKRI